ncbi:transcription elongation factor GreAB [Paenibacillus sp. LMG 31456]|uniref:Transcription elongation factor GreAB n=1 Tax=Paenibacillus foliorum TaxID=2654974 RepID=A0A972K2W8_9BACL|nr:GreA/GreB family elongation factor [Paenibacillus foliorum]NOU96355.1 transcription elongation factor GreAB [Paenibacillus foliorum]
MSHSIVLQGSRTQLINQLVYFDEQKKDFLDHYFPNSAKERGKIELLLSVYSVTLERILGVFTQENLNSTVLIGSRMKIVYLEDGYTESYTIVFPHQADPNSNKISFLSPIGFQLLMAKINETYQLKIPSGEIKVKLEEIIYNNCGDL